MIKITVFKMVALFILTLSLLGCEPGPVAEKKESKISFLEDQYQVVVPSSWKPLELNDESDLQYGNAYKEAYL